MHPILETRQRLVLYLATWIPIAALVMLILRRGPASWTEAAAIAAPLCVFYAFMCLSAWYVCRGIPLRDVSPSLLLALGAAALLSGAVWFAVGAIWTLVLEPAAGFAGLAGRYMGLFGPLFINGVLLFLLAAAAHYLLITFDEARQVERQALEMQVLAREAELKALRTQLDPHFLFNSLNSISALTVTDPSGARRMCILLADFLRTSLAMGSRTQIPVADELRMIDSFLDIEKVRYGSRLAVDRRIDPQCGDCMIPPLLIQPLVENAVRHGIANLVEGGTVQIDVRRAGPVLEILLENPMDAALRTNGDGVGLKNVRARLAGMFGRDADLQASRNDGHFQVRLRFPCIRTEQQA